ncbi:MAG: hypothetical protein LBT38_09010 [Deltaproteobacteria bacterium]|nr:hypothetical protein [Deltaproteobacteria bacterium]
MTIIIALSLVWSNISAVAFVGQDRQHIVYFEGTPQELEIYKIYGRQEGPTIMIMGGIQGDEPGGFLSADLYVDLSLQRGNLIVVPRANFRSIISFDRGYEGDMNRKFADIKKLDPDRGTVEIIKNLMAESDLFLNLHDGSGFFRPVWESDMANPNRYGQCVIADAEVYVHPVTGRVLHLGQEARRVVEMINKGIPEEKYKFHFSNHDTLSESSKHKEQRTSASYYALTRLGIPAFGLETSKQLPSLEMKVRQHNLAVNAFMELYGVIVEQPRVNLTPPTLNYLVISVNGELPVAVSDGQTLLVAPGDTVEVIHVGANYDRGLSVDVLGLGSLNDIRLPLAIQKPTTIIARRDNISFGQVKVDFSPAGSPSPRLGKTGSPLTVGAGLDLSQPQSRPDPVQDPARQPREGQEPETVDQTAEEFDGFVLEVNGQTQFLKANQTLTLPKSAVVKMVALKSRRKLSKNVVMNLRGFIGRPGDATGNDLGTTARLGKDLMSRFALKGTLAPTYQLGAEEGKNTLFKAYLAVTTPILKAVTLEIDGQKKVMTLGSRAKAKVGAKVVAQEIELVGGQKIVKPRYTLGGRPLTGAPPTAIMPDFAAALAVFSDQELAGKVVLVPVE